MQHIKSTGIIRRVDDLGRIVIPREIRKAKFIKEGEPIEFYIDGDDIILRKYSVEDEVTSLLTSAVSRLEEQESDIYLSSETKKALHEIRQNIAAEISKVNALKDK